MSVRDLIFPEGTQARKSRKPVRVLGIDLGTTNSTVAEILYDPSGKGDISVRCLAVEQPTGNRNHYNPLVPSVVAIHDGQEIVGEGARLLRSRSREAGMIEESNVFASVKNHMGLQRTYNMAPVGYRSAAEVSGRILAFLKTAAMKTRPWNRPALRLPSRPPSRPPSGRIPSRRHRWPDSPSKAATCWTNRWRP